MSVLERVRIPFSHCSTGDLTALDALLERPGPAVTPRASAILFAHGAGANKDSDFMNTIAGGLCARGFTVLRFDYPYMQRAREEGRRRPPDRRPVLERAHAAALETLERLARPQRVLLAGKSLGARIGSYLTAEDTDGRLARGLVFFGYPLHPKGQPERLRTEHFPLLTVPTLFLQGTRDGLCEVPLLEAALETYGGRATLAWIEDGDHDFGVLKRTGRERTDVLEELVDRVDEWERETFPD